MSGSLRSKQGCWTCRLRKKKCDESHPHCSTCQSLSITCYGYGARPDWMDSGDRERAVVNSLKETVKHTSRRKPIPQSSKHRPQIIKIAPKFSNGPGEISCSSSESNPQHPLNSASDFGSSQEDGFNALQDRSTDSSQPEDAPYLMAGSISSLPGDELVLVMHFLDHVLPLQYPMYDPGILEGGRGWLLHLLLRTKPLYHAALALGAYHRRATQFAMISHHRRAATLVQQEKHLEICIKTLSQLTEFSCKKKELGIATSIVQLMYFELFTGHSNAWKAHLRAAINMYQHGYMKNLANFGLSEESSKILVEDLPLPEEKDTVVGEVVPFRFLSGSIIWLDICRSITMGTAPQLLIYHSRIIASDSHTKLEDIMGCKNSAMLQIGRIAALHDHRTRALQQLDFDCAASAEIIRDIGGNIQRGIAVDLLGDKGDPSTLVTRFFWYMASFYLHFVTHGFHRLEILDTTMSRVMELLQTQTPVDALAALVSPLFIIGAAARHEDELFFRTTFSSPPLLEPSLKHRERMLPILEEIWRKRRADSDLTWKNSVDLTGDVLLL